MQIHQRCGGGLNLSLQATESHILINTQAQICRYAHPTLFTAEIFTLT